LFFSFLPEPNPYQAGASGIPHTATSIEFGVNPYLVDCYGDSLIYQLSKITKAKIKVSSTGFRNGSVIDCIPRDWDGRNNFICDLTTRLDPSDINGTLSLSMAWGAGLWTEYYEVAFIAPRTFPKIHKSILLVLSN